MANPPFRGVPGPDRGRPGHDPRHHVPRRRGRARQRHEPAERVPRAAGDPRHRLRVALLVTIVATVSVLWTVAGFESLGRPVSLSPLEIANAFGAPMLREGQSGISNMTVKELMEQYGDTRVQYLTTEEEDRVGGRGGGTDYLETAASAPSKRLQLCPPERGTSPQPQELFDG
ncbi:hypothetical protein PG997_011415 [Apiospora hydei]|uniref:Uncharacterized protein n=1 Tax=Apiospora hydei TaxID=1337664 RepID=A0ABR1VK00_9PEZI